MKDVGSNDVFPDGYRWIDYDSSAKVETSCVQWEYSTQTNDDTSDDCEYMESNGELRDKHCSFSDTKPALCEFLNGSWTNIIDIV